MLPWLLLDTKNRQNSIISSFFARRAIKAPASAEALRRSEKYFLVFLKEDIKGDVSKSMQNYTKVWKSMQDYANVGKNRQNKLKHREILAETHKSIEEYAKGCNIM